VFNADRTALVFRARVAVRRLCRAPTASFGATFQDYVDAMVDPAGARASQDKVYAAIQRLVVDEPLLAGGAGRCSSASHPRTLNRRLRDAGTSFRALQNQARHDLARELLRDTTSDVAAIASLLGYTSVSAFVRAFSNWEGRPPMAWRRGVVASR
jgi:methylphosphotriester-DNA--protein-cysteine methyltransferase